MEFIHNPVMPLEVLEGLRLTPGGIYVDCTLGGAGHSEAILNKTVDFRPAVLLIGLDQDPEALAAAANKLVKFLDRVKLVRANFAGLTEVLNSLEITHVDGIIFDLGVSSYQLDNPARGFSYQHNAPLDMRMDPEQEITAGYLVNNLPEHKLAKTIKDFGEERWAARIAQFIAEERKRIPIETTGQLVEIIKKAVPAGARRQGPHPARRTFQALRIAVNRELEILEQAVLSAVNALRPGGRICVITFHSLEDRIIKDLFRRLVSPCTCPRNFPVCVCGREKVLRLVNAKPVLASPSELELNPRARSAKLRVAERI